MVGGLLVEKMTIGGKTSKQMLFHTKREKLPMVKTGDQPPFSKHPAPNKPTTKQILFHTKWVPSKRAGWPKDVKVNQKVPLHAIQGKTTNTKWEKLPMVKIGGKGNMDQPHLANIQPTTALSHVQNTLNTVQKAVVGGCWILQTLVSNKNTLNLQ